MADNDNDEGVGQPTLKSRIWKEVKDWFFVALVFVSFASAGKWYEHHQAQKRREFFIAKLDTHDRDQKVCALVGLINDSIPSYNECLDGDVVVDDKGMVLHPNTKPKSNITIT
jgi:hypothetical protein